jgi:hypothetical protein
MPQEPQALAFAADDRNPWTTAGGPDPGFDAAVRAACRRRLTGAGLVEDFRRVEPDTVASYGYMIRALGLVWDCPDDEVVNVVGYCCGGCGNSREVALLAARCRGTIQSRARRSAAGV